MMDGYYRDEKATAEALGGGWFHTGDLVRWDADGRLYFEGRSKEMIRRSGENISPAEIEEVLAEHFAVEIALVLSVPDDVRGEEGKAYVQVLEGSEVADTDLIQSLAEFVGERLAYFKVPRYWELRAELPRTPSERVSRSALIDEGSDPRKGSYDYIEGVWL
jgi:crotonobetaine/carnitine-CoA ligase